MAPLTYIQLDDLLLFFTWVEFLNVGLLHAPEDLFFIYFFFLHFDIGLDSS